MGNIIRVALEGKWNPRVKPTRTKVLGFSIPMMLKIQFSFAMYSQVQIDGHKIHKDINGKTYFQTNDSTSEDHRMGI